jgi:hypothetical protein
MCSQLGGNPGLPRAPSNRFAADPARATDITLTSLCWRTDGGGGCPAWWLPGFYLYAADIELQDEFPPVITEFTGPPADSQGTEIVRLRASDRGGGLYRLHILVDGAIAEDVPYSATAARCVEPFAYAVPCPLSGESAVSFHTTRLSDGHHRVAFAVIDAAGASVQTEPADIAVDNAGRSCIYGIGGRSAPRFRVRRTTWRTRAGRRPVISGYLMKGRKPVRGLAVRAVSRSGEEKHFSAAGNARTNRRGRFRLRLLTGTSRHVRLAYCAPGGGAIKELRLKVMASSSIRANRGVVRNGRKVVFRGRLTGRPVPRVGKLVEIQAFFRGRWRTVSTTRTNKSGRWRFAYRFGGTLGRVKYRFRAFIPAETGYPYEPGASSPASVVVLGN